MELSTDSQAAVLLCSMLNAELSTAQPLTLKEWNELARKIDSSHLRTPGALFGLTANELSKELEITPDESARIQNLLESSAAMAIKLEHLSERGIQPITRIDAVYPSRLRSALKHSAPPVLFVAGNIALLQKGGIAVVGSRNIDDQGRAFAEEIGRRCARLRLPVVSGGARGTDALAMHSALEFGGSAVGVLADSLERAVRGPDVCSWLTGGQLTLLTPYSPSASFTIGAAMGRNKLIYAMAEFAVVVSSDVEKGGTWAGATEALKAGWCPVFVRVGENVPAGNLALLKKGALALPESELDAIDNLEAWMSERATDKAQHAELATVTGFQEQSLFAEPESDPPRQQSASPSMPTSHADQQVLIVNETATLAAAITSADTLVSDESTRVDLYQVAWPHIEKYLARPRSAADIGAKFQLERSQLRAWLKRAEKEGRVVKKGSPARFQRVND